MDLLKSKEYFDKYISNYDINVPKIRLKVVHTFHVTDVSRRIAEKNNLSKEEQDLAELIGLLHDIGRFEQVRIYNTFTDRESVDHAEKGVEVLFKNNEIRNFIKEDKYDEIIRKAIHNHNKFEIEQGLTEQELLYCKIIRDADKLDIFRAFLDEKLEDVVQGDTDDISKEILTPKIFEDFKKGSLLKYENCQTSVDFTVAILAFIYDLNFNESLEIIKENDYMRKIEKRINAKDAYTREKLDEIADIAMKYIDKKIGGN